MSKGYLLVFTTAIISGFSIFINQFGVKVTNPYIFTGLKNVVVALLLTGVLLAFKDWNKLKSLKKKTWFLLAAIGLLGGSIPFLLFFKGLTLTTAANGSFLHKTMFLYVAIFASRFLKEKLDRKFILGGIFLIIGNLLFLKKLSFSITQGDSLILLATLFWAAENTLSKYMLKELPGRTVAWGRMFFGSLFIFTFLFFTGQLDLLYGLNSQQINWIVITSAILLGYVITWYSGIRYVPVSKASVILLLGSPITTLLSFIQTGQVSLQNIFACALIVSGIVTVLGVQKAWALVRRVTKLAYVWG